MSSYTVSISIQGNLEYVYELVEDCCFKAMLITVLTIIECWTIVKDGREEKRREKQI